MFLLLTIVVGLIIVISSMFRIWIFNYQSHNFSLCWVLYFSFFFSFSFDILELITSHEEFLDWQVSKVVIKFW
jgi:hypothetical protein